MSKDGTESIHGKVRRDDHDTSIGAALKIARIDKRIQRLVYAAFEERGPMTDKELEVLPVFEVNEYSTARKRRGELCKAKRLVKTKLRRDGCAVWSIPGDPRLALQYGFG